MSDMGHFRPIGCVYAMSGVHPISTKLLHYGNRRSGPTAELESRRTTILIPGVLSKIGHQGRVGLFENTEQRQAGLGRHDVLSLGN
jgi:hypothetical protein